VKRSDYAQFCTWPTGPMKKNNLLIYYLSTQSTSGQLPRTALEFCYARQHVMLRAPYIILEPFIATTNVQYLRLHVWHAKIQVDIIKLFNAGHLLA